MAPNEKLTMAYLMTRLEPGHDANYQEFELTAPLQRHLVAHCQIDVESVRPYYAIFTLGRHSDRIFLTVTDGDPGRLASIFANIESYDSSVKELGYGHTMRLADSYLEQNQRPAVLFLRPDVHPFLDNLPYCEDLDGRHLEFLYVAFLSEEEYSHKLSHGLDSLVEKFVAEHKDLSVIAG